MKLTKKKLFEMIKQELEEYGRGMPKFQSANTLLVWDPEVDGGRQGYEIKEKYEGEFLRRFIIYKDGRQLEIHPKTNENEIYREATDMATGEKVDLIPGATPDYGQLKNMIQLVN
jgi:hypothetical protein